jgi:hypothetical protein
MFIKLQSYDISHISNVDIALAWMVDKFPIFWDRRGRDRMVVGFTTTIAISAYHH